MPKAKIEVQRTGIQLHPNGTRQKGCSLNDTESPSSHRAQRLARETDTKNKISNLMNSRSKVKNVARPSSKVNLRESKPGLRKPSQKVRWYLRS